MTRRLPSSSPARRASDLTSERRPSKPSLALSPTSASCSAPRAYLLRVAPENIARQVATCDPVPAARAVRVTASALRPGMCSIDVVGRDRSGLLARETAVLANLGLDVDDAVAATWSDGCALA